MSAARKEVKRHARTIDQYEADERSPGSVTIPKGRDDGRSYGFNPNHAGLIYVDPPLNGPPELIVDPRRIDGEKLAQLIRSGADPVEAFANFNTLVNEEDYTVPERRPSKTPVAGAYNVPQSPEFEPQFMPSVFGAPKPAPPPPQPEFDIEVAFKEVATALHGLNGRLSRVEEVRASPRQPVQPAFRPAPGRTTPLGDSDEMEGEGEEAPLPTPPPARSRPATQKRAENFCNFEIPFITGPEPQRPTVEVLFDIPNFGDHSAYYHDVIDSPDFLVLVYDRRYKDGQQFVPKSMGETVTLNLMIKDRLYCVHSAGIAFAWGAFGFLLMPKAQAAQAEADASKASIEVKEQVENFFAGGSA